MSWYIKPKMLNRIKQHSNYVFTDESGHILGVNKLEKRVVNMQEVDYRSETMFLLNSVFVSGKHINANTYHSNHIKKKYFGSTDFVFHSSHIHSKKGVFSVFRDNNSLFAEFGNEMTSYINKSWFTQFSTCMSKIDVIKNNIAEGKKSNEKDMIKHIYRTHILKIANMLNQDKKYAILVFESVSPQFDKLVLDIVSKLKLYGTKKNGKEFFKRIEAAYFVNEKSLAFKPFGELADLTSRPVYNYYCNIEYQQLKVKFHNFPNHENKSVSKIDKSCVGKENRV